MFDFIFGKKYFVIGSYTKHIPVRGKYSRHEGTKINNYFFNAEIRIKNGKTILDAVNENVLKDVPNAKNIRIESITRL